MENEKEFEERRDGYFDLIHSNSENSDWRAINKANFEALYAQREIKLQSKIVETFADGELEGEWLERGSRDVPGNIRVCDFHPATEDVFVVSDGGILWQGNIDGETWTPLNDGIQFNRRVVKAIDLPDGGVRLLAAVGFTLRYSDDNGETWGRGIWDFNISTVAGITESKPQEFFSFYPNPVTDGTLTINVKSNSTLTIFDLNGRVVASDNLASGTNTKNLSHLLKGTYVIAVKDNTDEMYMEKLVIGR